MTTRDTELLPPGTVHILRQTDQHEEIVLVPAPSSHADDPLNWTRNRKLLHIVCVYLYTFTTGIGGTATYSCLTDISQATGITLTQLNLGTGFIFLLAGLGNLIWQPLALSIGRRPVFLLSLLGCFAVSEWTAHIDSFPQWAAARILYGFLVAPVEVLPEISIPDIFFAHERGAYVGYYSLVLNGSNFIAPLIAGFINDGVGWQWVQHWAAIVLAANFLFALFFQEESMYYRDSVEAATQDDQAVGVLAAAASNTATGGDGKIQDKNRHSSNGSDSDGARGGVVEMSQRASYMQRLRLYSKSQLSLKQALTVSWRPIVIFFTFPNVTWAAFQYGFTNAWYSVYNATASSILTSEPYNLRSSLVGVTYLAPLVGALIGGYVAGPLSDKLALRLAHRAGGIREPEHRLWGLLSYAIVLPVGLILWGIGAAHSAHLAVLLLGSVFCGFGIVSGGTYAISYNIDCFKEIAGESMVSLILCRNTLTFAFSYAITPWILADGLQNTFIAVSIIAFVTGCSFLSMVWKGKQLRVRSAEMYWKYAADQAVKH